MKLTPMMYRTGLVLSTDGTLTVRLRIFDSEDEIVIAAREGRGRVIRWAIYETSSHGAACLSREGDWEFEPTPSSRDEEFFARCRYASLEEAVAELQKHLPVGASA